MEKQKNRQKGGFNIRILNKNNKAMQFTKDKKITISTSKKNNKTYRTYQINMDQADIRMMLNENLDTPPEKKKIKLYLIKKHIQHYDIKEKSNLINETIEITINLNNNKKTTPITLPKNNMQYIKAYDTYLETIDKINNETNNNDDNFDTVPLKATVLLNIAIDDETNTLKTSLSITNIRTSINKEFIDYIKEKNDNILPDWLNILTTDWNKEYLNKIFNKSNK